MSYNIQTWSTFFIIIMLFLLMKCVTYNKITVKGVTTKEKGGLAVKGYIITFSELNKYQPELLLSTYENKIIEVKGHVKEMKSKGEFEGEKIIQSRKGVSKFIIDIESIKVINHE